MQGVIAAVPTPVELGGCLMCSLFEAHCRQALSLGCDGLNIIGSTDKADSHDAVTCRAMMEWAASVCPKGRLMVGTGAPPLAETIALTEHAADLGYPAALVLPPNCCERAREAGPIAWHVAPHEARRTRKIEVHFRTFAQMTGLAIPVSVIAHLDQAASERFAGIKDSSGELDHAWDVLAAAPGLAVFPSPETALEHAAADGFAGCISAMANVACEIAGVIWATLAAPPAELARQAVRQRGMMAGPGLIPSIKALLAFRAGVVWCWSNVLPPFPPCGDAAGTDLAKRPEAA